MPPLHPSLPSGRQPSCLLQALCCAALLAPLFEASAHARMRPPPDDSVPAPIAKPEPLFPFGFTWNLREIGGKPVGGDPPTLVLDDKLRATGFSGCNTYSMTLYPVRNQKLLAGSIAMTHKVCDKDVNALERAFLVTLHSAPTWAIEGPDLVISGPTRLRFSRGL